MGTLEKGARRYLDKAGFNRLSDKPLYIKRNFADIAAAFLYSGISIICIARDTASMLVLVLNGLCMLRTILKNTIKSSETTDYVRKKLKKKSENEKDGLNEKPEKNKAENEVDEKAVGKYYYHIKAAVQIAIGAMIFFVMVLSGVDLTSRLLKGLTCLVIIIIFFDDLAEMCISIFHAEIEPLYIGEGGK